MPEIKWDVQKLQLLRKQLQEAKSMSILIVSGSMAPLLPVGCQCTIEPVSYEEIQSFDLVVFLADGHLICHAVWIKDFLPAANGERTLTTRGLNNIGFDYLVRESELLGRVVSQKLVGWQRILFVLRARFPLLRKGPRSPESGKSITS